ncbi:Myeloperoxidase [Manis pentadactyla]|nr:Myeloperoxidase [Manis pentadactyla]
MATGLCLSLRNRRASSVEAIYEYSDVWRRTGHPAYYRDALGNQIVIFRNGQLLTAEQERNLLATSSKKIKLLRSHSSQHAADGEIKILWENRETELFDSIEQRVVQPEEKGSEKEKLYGKMT